MRTISDGQVAASSTAILTAPKEGSVNIVLCNTSASTTETVVVVLLRTGSTARRILRAVLLPNEAAVIQGQGVAVDDIIKATTTNAATVDYTVGFSQQDVPFSIVCYDASGQIKQTSVPGLLNLTVGASTAGAGTTAANAGALPAGTATLYPTTAADGTVGVIINVADKVTGRTLIIGNGVSNAILKVYGPTGATINGAAADAAFSTASGKGCIITCLSDSGNTWRAE